MTRHKVTTRADPGGRYGLLLLTLVATYVLSAFSGVTTTADLQVVLFAAILLLALRTSPLPGRWPLLLGIAALAGSCAAVGVSLAGTRTGFGVADLWKALMLLLTAVLIVRRVLARPAVTIQSIYGALSAYLITGFMFAACYSAIGHLDHAPFFADSQPASTQTYQYFSFTTLTTLGYGDFTAAGSGGRAIAVREARAGQVFLATLVARLVASFHRSTRPGTRPRSRPRPAAVTRRAAPRSGRKPPRRPGTDGHARSDRRT